MWWLRFEEGNATVLSATSLVQARLIAFASGLDERRNELDLAQDRQRQDQRSRVGDARRRRRGRTVANVLRDPCNAIGWRNSLYFADSNRQLI
jgi:hypothetical protein